MRRLAANAGIAVPLAELVAEGWNTDPEKTVTQSPVVFVSRLRRKLDGICEIENVRGLGYRLVRRSRE